MSLANPSKEERRKWKELLDKEIPFKEDYFGIEPRETDGIVGLPAPAPKGGLFWRERIYTNWGKQERKKRQPVKHVCPECGNPFEASSRAQFCGRKCQHRQLVRRSREVTGKLPILTEDSK